MTGSVGKTGTKEMLRVDAFGHRARRTPPKNPTTTSGACRYRSRECPEDTRFGVFEIGMNHAGEITPLTRLVRPHIAIVTWVAPVHIEFFNSVAEIADAKAEIFEGLEQGGAAILPGAMSNLRGSRRTPARTAPRVVSVRRGGGRRCAAVALRAARAGSKVTASILGVETCVHVGRAAGGISR